jgi:poly(3-hydroxybutyrate) depolymerase
MGRPLVRIAALALVLCGAMARSFAAETMQLSVDGQSRSYLLERPAARAPSPTLIVLHGATDTAEAVARRTGLAQLGPQNGFVVVFPQSRGTMWNRFPPGRESPQAIELYRQYGGPPNDIGFIKALAADLVRRGIADRARIYLAGLSNGGLMALNMFCYESATFAGIGLITAAMAERTGEECKPAKPLPVVMVSGTADGVVPYGGGTVSLLEPRAPSGPSSFSVWSADRLTGFFRRLNGCTGPVVTSSMPAQAAPRIEVERAVNCTSAPVLAYKVVGGTHSSTPSALSTGKVLLDFFKEAAITPAQSTVAAIIPPSLSPPEAAPTTTPRARPEQEIAAPPPVAPESNRQPAPIEPRRRIALVIGNAAYPDADPTISQLAPHARGLAEDLRSSGYEVEVGENVSKHGLQGAIASFLAKITPDSAALVFFTGIAVQADRQTYILPIDADVWSEKDVARDGFKLETLLRDMNERGAVAKLAILDAARDNAYERRFRAVPAGLAPVTTPAGTLVIYATAPGHVVSDHSDAFVAELSKEIRAPGVAAEEAFSRTRRAVSTRTNGEQIPWISSSLTSELKFSGSGR